jgi:hypothetical protein
MIEVQLKQDQWLLGDTLQGNLIWTAAANQHPKQIIASLQWRTEGRGGGALEVVQKVEFDMHSSDQTLIQLPFGLELPMLAPISYDGLLLRVIWEICVTVDLPGLFTKDEKNTVPIRVMPR